MQFEYAVLLPLRVFERPRSLGLRTGALLFFKVLLFVWFSSAWRELLLIIRSDTLRRLAVVSWALLLELGISRLAKDDIASSCSSSSPILVPVIF